MDRRRKIEPWPSTRRANPAKNVYKMLEIVVPQWINTFFLSCHNVIKGKSKMSPFSPLHSNLQLDPKKGPSGSNTIPGNDDREIGQLFADLTNNEVRLTQLWVIFRVKLTDYRVIIYPEWNLTPMDPFWGQLSLTPDCLECALQCTYVIRGLDPKKITSILPHMNHAAKINHQIWGIFQWNV